MLLLDLTHTSHTRARTGIQRVCRALNRALAATTPTTAICRDPYLHAWRPLQAWETENLTATEASDKRGARWPIYAQIGGSASRLLKRRPPALPKGATQLVVPEVFSAAVAGALPELFQSVSGPRVAIFHDAIALQFPELSPPKTVARFPGYLRELLAFDGIAAVSEDSRDQLLAYWRWLGLTEHPPVVTIPLALDDLDAPPPSYGRVAPQPTVLSVGSIEGRKNHLALVEACDALWMKGHAFELRLIGLSHPQTGKAALDRIRTLQATGRSLRYDGPVDDSQLHAAYRDCAFTVYPSLIEGFGLPVLESLRYGKPCVCSARGALGESARGGGCLALDSVDAHSLATAIESFLTDRALLAHHAAAAARRPIRAWSTYAADLQTWMASLPGPRAT